MLKKIGRALQWSKTPRLWETCVPQDSYEVVILGGGSHGLACAYYLVKEFGVRSVAVLERSEFGVMENPWPAPLLGLNDQVPWMSSVYHASQKVYKGMKEELACDVGFLQRDLLSLPTGPWESGVLRGMGEAQRLRGGKTRFLTNEELQRQYPVLRGEDSLEGALRQPEGALLRPASVAWGYAGLAGRAGVDLCPRVKVEKLEIAAGRVLGVRTDRGRIRTGTVLNAAADWGLDISVDGMEKALLPVEYGVWISARMPPMMDAVIQCGEVYAGQGAEGMWYIGMTGAEQVDVGRLAEWAGSLIPDLRPVTFLHHWRGKGYRATQGTPVMGPWEIDGLFVDLGWGGRGFETAPACGRFLASWIASGQRPDDLLDLAADDLAPMENKG